MVTRHKPANRREGTAAVEFAVILIFIVPLLIGLWEVGRLVEVQQLMNNAVREGARQASTGNKDSTAVKQDVVQYLTLNGIPCAESNVTLTNMTSSARNNPPSALQLDQFHIEVKIPFNSVRWVLLNKITNVQDLSAAADFYSMRDIPLTINATIPVK